MDFIAGIKNRNKRVVSRFMSLIEDQDPEALALLKKIHPLRQQAHIVGITGPMGSGKSSIISQLLHIYSKKDLSIGVILVDPTSPYTGGAILGDRIRMRDHFLSSKIFIRSMAARGQLGGLATATSLIIQIMEAIGCEIILIETVGIGQSEIDIKNIADTSIVVVVPQIGDAVQIIKAGILEIADIFILNKSDLSGKDKIRLGLEQLLTINQGVQENLWKPPIIETVAIGSNETKINELADQIDNHYQYLVRANLLEEKQISRIQLELDNILKKELFKEFNNRIGSKIKQKLIIAIKKHEIDPYTAAQQILDLFYKN